MRQFVVSLAFKAFLYINPIIFQKVFQENFFSVLISTSKYDLNSLFDKFSIGLYG